MDIHEFAVRILQGLLSGFSGDFTYEAINKLVKISYDMAEKMIEEGQIREISLAAAEDENLAFE